MRSEHQQWLDELAGIRPRWTVRRALSYIGFALFVGACLAVLAR